MGGNLKLWHWNSWSLTHSQVCVEFTENESEEFLRYYCLFSGSGPITAALWCWVCVTNDGIVPDVWKDKVNIMSEDGDQIGDDEGGGGPDDQERRQEAESLLEPEHPQLWVFAASQFKNSRGAGTLIRTVNDSHMPSLRARVYFNASLPIIWYTVTSSPKDSLSGLELRKHNHHCSSYTPVLVKVTLFHIHKR